MHCLENHELISTSLDVFAHKTSIIWSNEYMKERLDYAPWNESLSCDEQLILTNSESIHVKNLLSLQFGALKYINGLCLPILENLFTIRKNSYNLRDHRDLEAANKNTKLTANLKTSNSNSLNIYIYIYIYIYIK